MSKHKKTIFTLNTLLSLVAVFLLNLFLGYGFKIVWYVTIVRLFPRLVTDGYIAGSLTWFVAFPLGFLAIVQIHRKTNLFK